MVISKLKMIQKNSRVIAKLVIEEKYGSPCILERIYEELRINDKLKDDVIKQVILIKNKIHR